MNQLPLNILLLHLLLYQQSEGLSQSFWGTSKDCMGWYKIILCAGFLSGVLSWWHNEELDLVKSSAELPFPPIHVLIQHRGRGELQLSICLW